MRIGRFVIRVEEKPKQKYKNPRVICPECGLNVQRRKNGSAWTHYPPAGSPAATTLLGGHCAGSAYPGKPLPIAKT